MKVKAYAKINIGLDITGRREDGYHLIDTIMQTVDLCDELEIEETRIPGVTMTCDCPGLACDDSNLVVRAAKLMLPTEAGVSIALHKVIPMGAGLGGGSADAAAVLKALNDMFEIGYEKGRLDSLGVALGADVPFALHAGTIRAEGIGQILTRLPSLPKWHVLIVKPSESVSTADIYKEYDHMWLSDEARPDMDRLTTAVKLQDMEGVAHEASNILERVTVKAVPRIKEIRQVMRDYGAVGSQMTGSGTAVWGIFRSREAAQECAAAFPEKEAYVTQLRAKEER
jgi:4-diphosphocytidyl-2-C-methyl-D-erythritol kinase